MTQHFEHFWGAAEAEFKKDFALGKAENQTNESQVKAMIAAVKAGTA